MTKTITILPKKPKKMKIRIRKLRNDAISEQDFARLLIKSGGNQSRVAESLGAAYSTVSERINKSQYLKNIARECMERRIDKAEEKLDALIEKESFNAICFFLKTQAKHRGYVENAPMTMFSPEVVQPFLEMMTRFKENQVSRNTDKTIDAKE